MALIHLAQALVEPPTRLPHIHDYAFAAYSCGHFVSLLLYCTYWQWTVKEAEPEPKSKTE